MDINGKIFVDRLRDLVRRENTKVTAVTNFAGLKNSAFAHWEKNNSFPRVDVAYKIAQFFNVSVEYLLTGEEVKVYMPPARIADIVSLLDSIADDDLETVRVVCKQLAQKNIQQKSDKVG